MLRSKTIFFSSASRTNGNINNFDTLLPRDLYDWNENSERAELELVNFSAKMSYYNISSTRNSQFIYSDNGVENTITIPDGNYSVKEIPVKIKTLLNAVATNITWNVTVDLNTLKYTYTYTGTPADTVYFKPLLSSFKILGFNDPVSPATYKEITTTTTTSDKIVSIGNIDSLFIHCSYVGAKNRHINEYNDESEHDHERIFAKVNIIGTSFFGTIYYDENNFKYTMPIPSLYSTNVQFSIRDSDSNLIELSEDYSMVLNLNIYPLREFRLDDLGRLFATKMLLKTPINENKKKSNQKAK